MRRIDDICRYKTEEYSADATYEFNIYPEQIPLSLMDSIPEDGTPKQNEAIFNLIKTKCDDLIGKMPLKICYPALEREDWHMITVLGHIIMEALALCLCLVHIGMHQARKTKIGQEGSSLGGEENFL